MSTFYTMQEQFWSFAVGVLSLLFPVCGYRTCAWIHNGKFLVWSCSQTWLCRGWRMINSFCQLDELISLFSLNKTFGLPLCTYDFYSLTQRSSFSFTLPRGTNLAFFTPSRSFALCTTTTTTPGKPALLSMLWMPECQKKKKILSVKISENWSDAW